MTTRPSCDNEVNPLLVLYLFFHLASSQADLVVRSLESGSQASACMIRCQDAMETDTTFHSGSNCSLNLDGHMHSASVPWRAGLAGRRSGELVRITRCTSSWLESGTARG
ncbi:unnamed protein product [Protopolystoma xenopodis]|uniref:Secreted protein n=1 Tax=Protopolystoma xenopodis TaxID=117903 RepID=A0A448XNT4_9PLAT|nr:unnamed protein product [Protopolystoma xenopodis]